MATHINIKAYGKVQGVYFRATTRKKAIELGIKGFVKNEQDGSVYIEAEGEEFIMKKFLEWCHQGPSEAIVDKIVSEEGKIQNFHTFEIR